VNYNLKRYGWHFKLQQWVFGKGLERINNMCPYFWLTNFCILVSPFVLLCRWIVKVSDIISSTFNRVIDYLFLKFGPKRKYNIAKHTNDLTNYQAYNLFITIFRWRVGHDESIDIGFYTINFIKMRDNIRNALRTEFHLWLDCHESDWQDILKAERKCDIELQAEKERAKINKNNKLYRIAEYTKTLVLLPIGVVLIYFAYYVGVLVLLIIENPMDALTIVITLIITMAVVVMLISFQNNGNISKFFKGVCGPVVRPIGSVLIFFGMNISLLYKNFCPQIDWKD